MNKFTITALTLCNGAVITTGGAKSTADTIELVDGVVCVAYKSGTVVGYNNWVDFMGVFDQPTPPAPTPASKRR